MKNSNYVKLLIMVLVAHYGAMKPVIQANQSIPAGYNQSFKGGESALLNLTEPGPVLSSNSVYTMSKPENSIAIPKPAPSSDFLGKDAASRPPVKLGTNSNTYTPRWLDTKSDLGENELEGVKERFENNFNEIKKNHPEITDEEILEDLAELFKDKSPLVEESSFEEGLSDYFEQLEKQVDNLNKDLETLLSYKQLNRLSEKYPLIIYKYEFQDENPQSYPDLMHNFTTPDEGEIQPISDSLK